LEEVIFAVFIRLKIPI